MAEQLNPIIISEYVHKEVLDKSTVLERLDKRRGGNPLEVERFIAQEIAKLILDYARQNHSNSNSIGNISFKDWLNNNQNQNGEHEIDNERLAVLHASATKIQAWYRGCMERQLHKAKIEHIQKQLAELKNAPCEEANPRSDRAEPMNSRIDRYVSGLMSEMLTERKIMAIRLARLAYRYHVAIEYMLEKKYIFSVILRCINDSNRSTPYQYILRPLYELIITLLKYKPFVDRFLSEHFDEIVYNTTKQIYYYNKDTLTVKQNAVILRLLSQYSSFDSLMQARRTHFDFYLKNFIHFFGHLSLDDDRFIAYQEIRPLICRN